MNRASHCPIHFGRLLLLAFLSAVIPAPVSFALRADEVNAPLSDQEFFDRVNLHHPGLESVRAAFEAGRLDEAKTALAGYYRNRTGTYFFIDGRNPAAGVRDPAGRISGAQDLVMRRGAWDESLWTGDRFDWETAEMRFNPS